MIAILTRIARLNFEKRIVKIKLDLVGAEIAGLVGRIIEMPVPNQVQAAVLN